MKRSIVKGVAQIGKAIQDLETKDLIDSLIQSYSKLDRSEIFGKMTYLVESLTKLCEPKGTEVIINLLSRGVSKGSWQIIEEVERNDVKQFLKALAMKYGAQFQWLLDPFPKDWERYNFSTKYIGVPSLPVISTRIIDKSGTLLELESPLTTYVDLVVAQIEHLMNIEKEMEESGQPSSIRKIVPREKLQKIKKIVEELLETPKKN